MNLVKSTGTFGFYTIISRLLGYLRDVLIAIFLGTSFLADVFFVAFRIPNTFRRLFAEGTFNAAFIPSYTSELVKKKSGSQKFANEIFNLLFLGLLFLVLIIEIFMPVFVRLRPSVLDPAGEATKSASIKLGAEGIKSLRIGKMIEVKIEGNGENEVREKIDLLCDRLFANTVIEDYEYSLEKL